MALSATERAGARDLALARWREDTAPETRRASVLRHSESRYNRAIGKRLQSAHVVGRALNRNAQAKRLTRQTKALVFDAHELLRRSERPATLEYLVEGTITRLSLPLLDPRLGTRRGVGLAASTRPRRLFHSARLLGHELSRVVRATDAGTALGLAITLQPDLAIIDSSLGLASGIDLARVLSLYSPATRCLVLTDDDESAEELRALGIETEKRDADNVSILRWIRRVA